MEQSRNEQNTRIPRAFSKLNVLFFSVAGHLSPTNVKVVATHVYFSDFWFEGGYRKCPY